MAVLVLAPGRIDVAGVATAEIDTGAADGATAPPVLLHGSGPGVMPLANWRPVIPALSADALEAGPADVIGNSMGGAIALSIAAARPDAVRRIVLMGSRAWRWPCPPG
jgi:pimeloyl-ACP methyl ester carboxylesterase